MNIDLMNAIARAVDDGNGVKREEQEDFIRNGFVVENKEEETITISLERYNELLDHEAWVSALEAAGVDNWTGYDEACDILREYNGEES
jgi:hypothetical protein